jgi:hypothetical protein
MAENKTQPTKKSPVTFIKTIKSPEQRADATVLLKLFEKVTRQKAVMWGSIFGFGTYTYQGKSRSGEWPMTAFAVRANSLTVYLMNGFKNYAPLLKKLGKHKISGDSCLYIKRLADVDMQVLEKIVTQSYTDMQKKYSKRRV